MQQSNPVNLSSISRLDARARTYAEGDGEEGGAGPSRSAPLYYTRGVSQSQPGSQLRADALQEDELPQAASTSQHNSLFVAALAEDSVLSVDDMEQAAFPRDSSSAREPASLYAAQTMKHKPSNLSRTTSLVKPSIENPSFESGSYPGCLVDPDEERSMPLTAEEDKRDLSLGKIDNPSATAMPPSLNPSQPRLQNSQAPLPMASRSEATLSGAPRDLRELAAYLRMKRLNSEASSRGGGEESAAAPVRPRGILRRSEAGGGVRRVKGVMWDKIQSTQVAPDPAASRSLTTRQSEGIQMRSLMASSSLGQRSGIGKNPSMSQDISRAGPSPVHPPFSRPPSRATPSGPAPPAMGSKWVTPSLASPGSSASHNPTTMMRSRMSDGGGEEQPSQASIIASQRTSDSSVRRPHHQALSPTSSLRRQQQGGSGSVPMASACRSAHPPLPSASTPRARSSWL